MYGDDEQVLIVGGSLVEPSAPGRARAVSLAGAWHAGYPWTPGDGRSAAFFTAINVHSL